VSRLVVYLDDVSSRLVDDGEQRRVITPDRPYRAIDENELAFVPKGHAPSRRQHHETRWNAPPAKVDPWSKGKGHNGLRAGRGDLPTAARSKGARRVFPPAP
jgi:hypothetical protein